MNKISVVGIGRLGLCSALCFETAGYSVLGVDNNESYVASINDGTFRSNEPGVNDMLSGAAIFSASSSMREALEHSKNIYILVPTPTVISGDGSFSNYDTKILEEVFSSINSLCPSDLNVIIGCTVMPGYTARVISKFLPDCDNVSVSYNPEFIRQGSIVRDFLNPDMVLIGEGSKEAGDYLERLYKRLCGKQVQIRRMSPTSAEICKLSVNSFITMKIAFANMIGDMADETEGANKDDILEAIGTDSRIGTKCLKYGYAFGGPCFPRDNMALFEHSRLLGMSCLLPLVTDETNSMHTEKQTKQLLDLGLDSYVIEGVAYKENCPVDIIENSPKIDIALRLVEEGKIVTIRDRKSMIKVVREQYGDKFLYETL